MTPFRVWVSPTGKKVRLFWEPGNCSVRLVSSRTVKFIIGLAPFEPILIKFNHTYLWQLLYENRELIFLRVFCAQTTIVLAQPSRLQFAGCGNASQQPPMTVTDQTFWMTR